MPACANTTGWGWLENTDKFGSDIFQPLEVHSLMEEMPFNGTFKYEQYETKNEGLWLTQLNMTQFLKERGYWSDRFYHRIFNKTKYELYIV